MDVKKIEKKELFLFGALVTSLIIILGMLIYLNYVNQPIDYYTEFYFEQNNYPNSTKAGIKTPITFTIVNNEKENTNYIYKIIEPLEITKKVMLNINETKNIKEMIIFNERKEEKQRVFLELYKNDLNSEPLTLWIWVKVE